MRICIGFHGQARFVELGARNTVENLLNLGAEKVDVVLHTWKTTSPKTAAPWAQRHQIVLSSFKEAKKILRPVAYVSTEHNLDSKFESACRKQNDSPLCFNLAQMFFSLDRTIALLASTGKIYDSYLLCRFDFWSDLWKLPVANKGTVLSPKIIPTSKICDWLLVVDYTTLTQMAGSPISSFANVLFAQGPTLAGEEILMRYLDQLGLSVKSFRAGGRIVRDREAKVFWGRPDIRSHPMIFLWKTIKGHLGVRVTNRLYVWARKIMRNPIKN